jgi:hypothetical protein
MVATIAASPLNLAITPQACTIFIMINSFF